MKKHIVTLTAISGLFFGAAGVSAAEQSYTVKSGDTLWSIAQNNQVSVEDIQTWNDLDSSLIFPKQELTLENFKSYIVASGDTLSGIAKAYGISVEEIKGWSGISSDLIVPGQVVFVEGNDFVAPKAVESASATVNTSVATTTQAASAPATTAPATTQKQAQPTQTPATSAPATAARTFSVEATAYTAYCTGCSGITKTGIDLRSNPNQKVIAVDPNVIPLGSRVWVEGYGEAIAGDTGGAIKGNKIDLFMPQQQDALNWGRQTVTIKILD